MGDGLAYASPSCRHAGEDVGLVIVCKGDDGFHGVVAFVVEQVYVISFAFEYHGVGRDEGLKLFGSLSVGLDDFDVVVYFVEFPAGSDGEFAASDDEAVVDGWVVVFACQVAYLVEFVFCRHEEDEVSREYFLISVGAYCLSVAFDGYDVEVVAVLASDVLEGVAYELVVFVAYLFLVDGVGIVHLDAEHE